MSFYYFRNFTKIYSLSCIQFSRSVYHRNVFLPKCLVSICCANLNKCFNRETEREGETKHLHVLPTCPNNRGLFSFPYNVLFYCLRFTPINVSYKSLYVNFSHFSLFYYFVHCYKDLYGKTRQLFETLHLPK